MALINKKDVLDDLKCIMRRMEQLKALCENDVYAESEVTWYAGAMYGLSLAIKDIEFIKGEEKK